MDVTNSLIKWVYSLAQKKNRVREKSFVVEGTKCVLDTIAHFGVRYVFATSRWIAQHGSNLSVPVQVVSTVQLERMSMLKSASEVLAVYEMPEYVLDVSRLVHTLSLALDNVQDPGNLGTIVRIADWFGIRDILCSESTVDIFNPKVVQATMGAISRVRVSYCDLSATLASLGRLPIYGTFLNGKNIYHEPLATKGVIVLGNEGSGISTEVSRVVTDRLFIPPYPETVDETSESLNVSMATAIVVSEFRRRMQ